MWLNALPLLHTTSKEYGQRIVEKRKWSSQNDQHGILLNENHWLDRIISENEESMVMRARVWVPVHIALASTELALRIFEAGNYFDVS